MKVDRLVSIIMILLDKERIGAQELADMFEVSPRTIYRDIDTINLAGIPVRATSGVGGGFEIMEKYKLDNKVFSSNELSILLMGLSSLSNMMHTEELTHTLAKVKSFIPADQAKAISLKAGQISIDLSPWIGNKNISVYLEKIKAALLENKLLSFEYTDGHGNQTLRAVEPYKLLLKDSHWYLHGYCQLRNDFRLFKLSRMSDLNIEEETFTLREYQEPTLEFDEILKSIQETIKIRIHKSVMDNVLVFCDVTCFSQDEPDYYLVDFPFIENDYYYNVLLSFGDKCECLEPSHVRAEMKLRIQNLALMYNA